jgi:hypothetical protein
LKNWKQKIVPAALAISLLMPMGAYAAEGIGQVNPPLLKKAEVKAKALHHFGLRIGTHREMYFLLLAEKYTPGSLADWKAVLAERERLIEEWKSLKPREQWQEKKEEFRSNVKEKMAEIKEKVKNGEVTKEQVREQVQQWKEGQKEQFKGWKEEKKAQLEPLIGERKELFQAFTQAIESGDDEAIAAVLPNILKEVQRVNQVLAQKIDELKKLEGSSLN